MAVSRSARKPGRVVRFIDTSQHPQRVDADDSEAAAVLSTLVFECEEKNAMMPSQKPNTIERTQRAHRRRRSRLLNFFGSENFTTPTESSSIAINPVPKQVNLPSHMHASQFRSRSSSNFAVRPNSDNGTGKPACGHAAAPGFRRMYGLQWVGHRVTVGHRSSPMPRCIDPLTYVR